MCVQMTEEVSQSLGGDGEGEKQPEELKAMSAEAGNKKTSQDSEEGPAVDKDLSELLDSALEDFGKARKQDAQSGGGGVCEDPPDEDLPPVMDQKLAQQAAAEFQNMLRQLVEVQKVVIDQGKEGGDNVSADALPPVGSIAAGVQAAGIGPSPESGREGIPSVEDEAGFSQALLQNLQSLADRAQKVSEAGSEGEFLSAMNEMQEQASYEQDFLPFMQSLMGSLLSKEMMYPSLKEMAEKYPVWLDANKASLTSEDSNRYSAQLNLIQRAVSLYDEETEEDTDEVRGKRFEEMIQIMQQMQLCGQPPEDLVGSLPPGWSVDDQTGLPQVTDSQAAAESCCLM